MTGLWNLTGRDRLRSGADWSAPIGFTERGGWCTSDAQRNPTLSLTSGSVTATCVGGLGRDPITGLPVTKQFTADDDDLKIATSDGTTIVDGTTMAFVNATTVTLSAAATATGLFVASVRSLNCTNYTDHLAQVKKAPGGDLLFTIGIDTTRNAVGWHVLSVAGTLTEPDAVAGKFLWDWRVTGPEGEAYWYAGQGLVEKNVSIRA